MPLRSSSKEDVMQRAGRREKTGKIEHIRDSCDTGRDSWGYDKGQKPRAVAI
jgi:hypothetical protein